MKSVTKDFFTALTKCLSLCFMLLRNLCFSAKAASASGFIKNALKLIGKGLTLLLLFLAPYWHKLPHLLLFSWTLFLHSCISPIGKQATQVEISCPDGYAYKLSAEDLPSAEGARGKSPINDAVEYDHYIACEDFDHYMETKDSRYVFSRKSTIIDPGGPFSLNARSQRD